MERTSVSWKRSEQDLADHFRQVFKLVLASALLAAFASTGALAAGKFSHEFHLKLIRRCTDCHSAASTSTNMADDLRPAEQVCAKCHQDGRSGRPTGAPETRKPPITGFNHALHSKLGNVASLVAAAIDKKTYVANNGSGIRVQLMGAAQNCEGCHRGLRLSDTRSAEHHLPQMADCLVCHNRIDVPYSCEKCHNKEQAAKPANHTEDFHSTHSNKVASLLDRTTCANCHGRTFSCQGCH